MITINQGKITIPKDDMFIGFSGDNLTVTRKLLLVGDTNESKIYRMYLKFDDGTYNHFTLDSEQTEDGVLILWEITKDQIFKSGALKAQIKITNSNGEISHTPLLNFYVLDSIEFSDSFKNHENSEFLLLEEKLNDLKLELQNERSKLPMISDDNTWLLYDVEAEKYEDSGISCVASIDTTVFEKNSNKVTQLGGRPSDDKYPSEKAVFDFVDGNFLNNEYVVSEIPENTASLDDGDVLTAKAVLGYIDTKTKQSDEIPDYWNEHLASKIDTIKALQDEGGKDAFSFVVMTDMHYESNLGKNAPLLAKRIMDECGIKYCLCLGDLQTRHGANHNRDYILNEWNDIEKMLSPIRDRLLIAQGNHDGSFGIIDSNADGVADDINADGIVDNYDKCVYNLTPKELYNKMFRKVSLVGDVHFDESGSAYYVDDTANKVRFIVLNTHNNSYEENADGTAVYNNMTHFRFTQSQYDLVVEALQSITDDKWSVVVSCHVPLDRTQEYVYWGGQINDSGSLADGSIADCTVMQRLLNAYHNKTSYTGAFMGTAAGGAKYTNYADTESDDWEDGAYINSSGNVATATATDVTNFIPASAGQKVRIKNLTVSGSGRLAFYDSDKNYLGVMAMSTLTNGGVVTTEDGVTTYHNVAATTLDGTPVETLLNTAYVRFVVSKTEGVVPIITVDEEILESETGYDSVNVSVDFTSAKGELIALFSGHVHADNIWNPTLIYNDWEKSEFPIISTRCDSKVENTEELQAERVQGTTTEQSFDVFTINKSLKKIYATKIGAGDDRSVSYK